MSAPNKRSNDATGEEDATSSKASKQSSTDSPTPQAPVINLQQILNAIPDLIFGKDLQGTYKWVNSAIKSKFGDDIVGKTDYDFFDKELADDSRRKEKAAMDAGVEGRRDEVEVVFPAGKRATYDTIKVPWIDDEGTILGIIGCCREITSTTSSTSSTSEEEDKEEATLREFCSVGDEGGEKCEK
jgi:PAS domain S-box-containing protein